MALAEELHIYKQMYALLNLLLDAKDRLPKAYKYAFGERLMMTALECCELIQSANMDRRGRAELLRQFAIRFGSLRLMIRLMRDRRLVDVGRFAELLALAGEIGAQATAWRRASE